MEVAGFIVAALGITLIIRLVAGSMDRGRVAEYVEERGGKVLELRWTPFGKGWFGTKGERLYALRYRDPAGTEHEATCKTSAFAGVYLTEDRPVGGRGPVSEMEALREENRRLVEELARLRRTGGGSQ